MIMAGTTYAAACAEYEREGRYLVWDGDRRRMRLASKALVKVGSGYACIDSRSGYMKECAAVIRSRDNNKWSEYESLFWQEGEAVVRLRSGRPRRTTAAECGVT